MNPKALTRPRGSGQPQQLAQLARLEAAGCVDPGVRISMQDPAVFVSDRAYRAGRLHSNDSRMAPATGTIKRITDRGFGFIAAPDGVEYFFHQSACTSTPFDSLREGDTVTFALGQGPKGPRAEDVRPA